MALLQCWSFDDGLNDKRWSYNTIGDWATHVSTEFGRHEKGIQLGDNENNEVQFGFAERKEIYLGMAINPRDVSPGQYLFLRDSGGDAIVLDIDSLTFQLHVQHRGGTVSSTASALPLDVWTYVELYAKHGDSTGAVEVRINESTVISATGIDTRDGGDGFNSFQLGGVASGEIDLIYVDDIYLLDATSTRNNTFLGDVQVNALTPNADGTINDFLGSDADSSSNYALVYASSYSTSDYVQSEDEGDQDMYNLTNPASTNFEVYGVETHFLWGKNVSGTKYLRTAMIDNSTAGGGSTFVGDVFPLGVGADLFSFAFDTNPVTSSTWTIDSLENMEIGQEVRNST